MKKEEFWKKLVKEEYQGCWKIRLWWEKFWFDKWWEIKGNKEFVEQIPNEK